MTGSVVLFGIGMTACALAFVVGAVLMGAVSPCDGGPGVFPLLLLLAAVVGGSAVPVTAAVTGSGRVADVVSVAVAVVVGVPAVVGGWAHLADRLRFRSMRSGVR